MLEITKDAIHLTRGDNANIIVTIRDAAGEVYELQSGDKLYFTMKQNCETTDVILQKNITHNSTIAIEHDDTKDLQYGVYKFDVQLKTAGGEIYTVIDPHDFYIEKEVNFNG